MQPGFFKQDTASDEDRFVNDGLVSIIDNDYVMNFLNDMDTLPKRPIPTYQFYQTIPQDLSNNLGSMIDPDQNRHGDPSNNLFSKAAIHKDSWLLPSYNEQRMNNLKVEHDNDSGDNSRGKRKNRRETSSKKAQQEAQQAYNYKNNIKNTYINKINSLINDAKPASKPDEEKLLLDEKLNEARRMFLQKGDSPSHMGANASKMGVKKVRSYDTLKFDEFGKEKLNMKLARNRESARNSRKRKKVYIELLEKKVEHLTQELNATKKQLELNSNNMNKMSMQTKLMNGLVQGKQQLFDKLEKMLQANVDESEVNLLIDSLRLRLGATGRERVNAINYFFKQVYDILIPVHMKYLLWIASEGKDLFSGKTTTLMGTLPPNLISADLKNDTTDYWNALVTQVNLTDSQKNHILKYRKKLVQEKTKFETLLNSLNQTRKQILKQANSIQNVIDDFRNILTPTQVGKFLIMLDKERNRKEFSAEKLWQNFIKKEPNEAEENDESDHFIENLDNFSEPEEDTPEFNNSNFDLNFSFDYKDAQDFVRKKRHTT